MMFTRFLFLLVQLNNFDEGKPNHVVEVPPRISVQCHLQVQYTYA
ncbi:hypothetical protein EV213_102179 [Aureibacillus halotolerans]|uniref:Uncharacterized protein n=1 Tax=Aureibacillus halotolerans TaxID=1508390 RepID=A0A4R6UB46_9BACI|nr:hypothetical protein EV213_102179 [Aureibacillus halotolerans]